MRVKRASAVRDEGIRRVCGSGSATGASADREHRASESPGRAAAASGGADNVNLDDGLLRIYSVASSEVGMREEEEAPQPLNRDIRSPCDDALQSEGPATATFQAPAVHVASVRKIPDYGSKYNGLVRDLELEEEHQRSRSRGALDDAGTRTECSNSKYI